MIKNSKEIVKMSFCQLVLFCCSNRKISQFKGINIPDTIFIDKGRPIFIVKTLQSGILLKNENKTQLNPQILLSEFNKNAKNEKAYIRYCNFSEFKIFSTEEFRQLLLKKERLPFKNIECIQAYVINSNKQKDFVYVNFIAPLNDINIDGTINYKFQKSKTYNNNLSTSEEREIFKNNCYNYCIKICNHFQKMYGIV